MSNDIYDLTLDITKPLPQHLSIKSAESHFHRIVLSLLGFDSVRSKLYNPKFLFTINMILIIRSIVALSIHTDDPLIFLMLGDVSYFIDLKFHFNILEILVFMFAI